MSATRAAESRAEANPENERDPPAPEESIDRHDDKEKLYVEVLHTIANTVGAPAPGGQVSARANNKKKEEDKLLKQMKSLKLSMNF